MNIFNLFLRRKRKKI